MYLAFTQQISEISFPPPPPFFDKTNKDSAERNPLFSGISAEIISALSAWEEILPELKRLAVLS